MHFTYTRPPKGELQQGDILRRTKALEDILKEYHPFYLKEDYKFFIVLTQTCDLVNRDTGYKAPYVSIGAVRPLSSVIERETSRLQTNHVLRSANAVSERNTERMRLFLKSLLNNNNHEYFYLHEQPTGGLPDRYCAYLRLSVSVRSEHYHTLSKARILSLKPQFQAKLGWLIGNIYARVGTDDWTPKHLPEPEWNSLIDQLLLENVVFLPDRQVEYVKKNKLQHEVEAMDVDTARAEVKAAPLLKTKDEVIEIVVNDLIGAGILDEANSAAATAVLAQSARLKSKVKN